jgi:UDP-N-acetylglucosamine 4,6-dehydratase
MKKRYLIFGGSGSLGTSLIKRLCIDNDVCIYSRDESKHWALKNKFSGKNISFMIGDIRDKDRVAEVISRFKPNVIIIASALKHVDICELSPEESIKTNIIGPQNIANVVEENSHLYSKFLETVLMVSTDKACAPINVYGMCKAIAERVVLEKARNVENNNIKFCAVRYGNVLESRGSIIPLFLYQAKNNECLTVTREDMTRFLMTLNDSVDLILDCIQNAENGELYIPKLKSMRIIDLANIFSKRYNKPVQIVGIRSGEKIHEAMINETESLRTIERNNRFVVKPIYDTTIYNQNIFQFDSSMDVLEINVLEEYLESLGYLSKDLSEFNDTTIDVIRKISQDDIRQMTR